MQVVLFRWNFSMFSYKYILRKPSGNVSCNNGVNVAGTNLTPGVWIYVTSLCKVWRLKPKFRLDKHVGLAVRDWKRVRRDKRLGGRRAWSFFQSLPHSSIQSLKRRGEGWSLPRPQQSSRRIWWENIQESNEVRASSEKHMEFGLIKS